MTNAIASLAAGDVSPVAVTVTGSELLAKDVMLAVMVGAALTVTPARAKRTASNGNMPRDICRTSYSSGLVAKCLATMLAAKRARAMLCEQPVCSSSYTVMYGFHGCRHDGTSMQLHANLQMHRDVLR